MNTKIELHKGDLPENINFQNTTLAVDCEFMGLQVRRDPLCLIQVSSGNSDAHIVQLDKENYNAPNLKKLLTNKSINKIFENLERILIREKRLELYNNTIKFISTRVDLDLAAFKDDIWSH